MGLHRNFQSVVACNRRPRVETAASLTTLSSLLEFPPKATWGRTSLPTLWPPGDQCWRPAQKRVVTRPHAFMLAARHHPVPWLRDHLLRYGPRPSWPALATPEDFGSWHGVLSHRHVGVGGSLPRSAHCSLLRTHKPGSPLLLCPARTLVPLAPVQTHSWLLFCPLRSYPPFPKSTDPYSISRSQI